MQGEKSLSVYRTVERESEIELVIKRSRFIGRCFPVSSEPEALSTLERVRKQNRDASHNCFAYVIGERGAFARFSDDGEPGGTAGMPMMETLKSIGAVDVLCIVTRYFGGILLGSGGLVRAYSGACSEAVKAANIVEMRPCVHYGFEVDYPKWGMLQSLLSRYGSIDSVEYSDRVRCAVWVPNVRSTEFIAELTERSDGKISAQFLGQERFPCEPEGDNK